MLSVSENSIIYYNHLKTIAYFAISCPAGLLYLISVPSTKRWQSIAYKCYHSHGEGNQTGKKMHDLCGCQALYWALYTSQSPLTEVDTHGNEGDWAEYTWRRTPLAKRNSGISTLSISQNTRAMEKHVLCVTICNMCVFIFEWLQRRSRTPAPSPPKWGWRDGSEG